MLHWRIVTFFTTNDSTWLNTRAPCAPWTGLFLSVRPVWLPFASLLVVLSDVHTPPSTYMSRSYGRSGIWSVLWFMPVTEAFLRRHMFTPGFRRNSALGSATSAWPVLRTIGPSR